MPTPPTPTSGVIDLLNVPWDAGYKNVVDFDDDDLRHVYMQSRIIQDESGKQLSYSFDNCQYSRRDGVLKVPVHIDDLYKCNYLMYKNPYYSDKWFYCFVIGMRYINDNCTELRISTDVYSTWINSAEIKASYVEREHTNDDTLGKNLVPEGLETGELIDYEVFNPQIDVQYTITPQSGEPYTVIVKVNPLEPVVCMAYSHNEIDKDNAKITLDRKTGGIYNGIPSSINYLLTDIKQDNPSSKPHINELIDKINNGGQGNYIFAVFSVPVLSVISAYYTQNAQQAIRDNKFVELPLTHKQPERTIFNTTIPEDNNGYVPKNKKLLTYPYCYLGFTAPNGTPKIYRYENFKHNEIMFEGISEINPNPTVVIYPKDYNRDNDKNISQAVTINGYPSISYINDYFNAWLAQNSQIVNLSVDRTNYNYDVGMARNAIAQNRESANAMANMISTAVGGVASALTGNVIGTINSAVTGAQSAINSMYNMQELGLSAAANTANWQYDVRAINAQVEKQALLPDTGVLSSSNATLLGYGYFAKACFSRFGIKPEYAKRIDQYFDMFGYQSNEVKKPNLKGRLNWNYVKTVNVNIQGPIPTQDLQRLKGVFDAGVTIWHDVTQIYKYDNDNPIVKQ